ncbi:MAG: hypothetical protein ABI591_28825 [Kofleriaceae bacterium]
MTVDPIETRVAHTGGDELRFRGYRVFGQLLGETSAAQILILGMTGTLLDRDAALVVDDILVAMSSADPRLWPFKVTRLASAHGSVAAGVAATLLAGEGGMYGSNRLASATSWLTGLADRGPLDDAAMLAIVREGAQGFGVLYRARDERFVALAAQIAKRGRHELRYWRLCMQAVRVARSELQLEAHVYLGLAALCLDLRLAPQTVAALSFILLFHDGLANATEGADQQPPVLRELPWSAVDDRSMPLRQSPHARGQ